MLEDLHYLRERAQKATARGDHQEAARLLFDAAQQTHVTETDYASVLKPLAAALTHLGRPRDALTVAWYLALAEKGGAEKASWQSALTLAEGASPHEQARTLAAAGRPREAARAAEAGGKIASAAIHSEHASDFVAARALWARLFTVLQQSGAEPYLRGLVAYNLARCAAKGGDQRGARDAQVTAVRLMEEAADEFESTGKRERAFDCFQVLVQIGHESHAFEHVLEGYVNSVRILREDHLKYFVLQHYDDAIVASRERRELAAAATLAREAASYARTIGLSAASRNYALDEGSLWELVADDHKGRGSSPAIAENAMLAAILAYADVGQFARVGRLSRELGDLPLEDSRRAHYARVAERYQGVGDELVEKSPLAGRGARAAELPAVWHDDVVEWEEAGSAEEACATVLCDAKWPELTRRRAMLARLASLRVPAAGPERTAALASLAQRLAHVQVYAVLSPLEHLFESPEEAVKLAVLEALQTLFFKRTFMTLRAAIADGTPELVTQAASALRALHFPHAFDPLARILHDGPPSEVRAAALDAIAHIDTQEAAELLLGVLEHGSPEDRQAVTRALGGTKAAKFIELAKATFASAPRAVQGQLRDILTSRGVAV